MNLANNYFLLYHGIQIDKRISFNTTKSKSNPNFFEIAALILVPTRKNSEKFLALDSFITLCEEVSNKAPTNLDELNQLQYDLLDNINNKTEIEDFKKLNNAFLYLHKENILDLSSYNKLVSLFDSNLISVIEHETNLDKKELNNKTFQENKLELETVIDDLKSIFTSKELIEELDEVSSYINNQKFSIGITGVMNAGKSTMLNALMGQEILGSAVVPETANLTIVKHDEASSAKVFFWNTNEWNNIVKSANEFEEIATFVQETQTTFKEDLNKYIQNDSYNIDVNISDLALYTSAQKSGKKCNLVKYVELKSNLEFLKDGIEIVDTPGLDDPVIQREEITKEYLSQCDLMLHLMNVSQSATLKDVEFIIDALLYQNISKLLIVITRADTVSKKELNEVIEYTKKSIKQQLTLQNKDNKLDYILNTIKFIPISGKMALLHRTNKADVALKAGYTLEDTGILQIEEYLLDTLFGSDSNKSDLIIKSSKNKLLKTIEKELKSLHYEIILLSKSKEELELDLKEFNNKKIENEQNFITIKNDIINYKNEAIKYIQTLETFIKDELIDLQLIIKQRVFNDVKYSLEKDKKRPESSRIKTIIQTAIKDGIIDIVRDYRYKFIKKSQDIGEVCEQKYNTLGFVLDYNNDNFDARGFFQDEFKTGFLTSSNEILINKIIQEVVKAKESKLIEFDRQIEIHIRDEFEPINLNLKDKTNIISQLLIENFFNKLQEPLKIFEHQLIKDEKILLNRISTYEDNEKNKDVQTIQIHQKIKKLDDISKGLKI